MENYFLLKMFTFLAYVSNSTKYSDKEVLPLLNVCRLIPRKFPHSKYL